MMRPNSDGMLSMRPASRQIGAHQWCKSRPIWQKRSRLVQKRDGTQFAMDSSLALDMSDATLIFKGVCQFGPPAR
jgi:hypothetical protein